MENNSENTITRKSLTSIGSMSNNGHNYIYFDPHSLDVLHNVIAPAVQKVTGVSLSIIRTRKRQHHIVLARQMLQYFLRKKTTLNLASIAHVCDIKEHASAIYSIRNVDNLLHVKDEEYTRIYNLIADCIKDIEINNLNAIEFIFKPQLQSKYRTINLFNNNKLINPCKKS